MTPRDFGVYTYEFHDAGTLESDGEMRGARTIYTNARMVYGRVVLTFALTHARGDARNA